MLEQTPWDEIVVPSSGYNVKLVPGKMPVPCYWGRDVSGSCLFIMELEGNHSALFNQNTIVVTGIVVDLRAENSCQRLVLTLEAQADRDLFFGLCKTLSKALEHVGDATSSLAMALAHIRRWKAFMSGRSQRLSDEEVQGLFAELVFLLELMDSRSVTLAVNAWMGPERSHQDFIFENTAVEVKSLSGLERNSVRISSEDQLESLNENLFLRIYKLSKLEGSASARSLNQLVSEVQGRLDDAQAIEEFDRKLSAHSYAPLPDYDVPTFVVSHSFTYRVENDFPKLVRSKIPEGISKLSYEIKLESIENFKCPAEGICGGRNGINS